MRRPLDNRDNISESIKLGPPGPCRWGNPVGLLLAEPSEPLLQSPCGTFAAVFVFQKLRTVGASSSSIQYLSAPGHRSKKEKRERVERKKGDKPPGDRLAECELKPDHSELFFGSSTTSGRMSPCHAIPPLNNSSTQSIVGRVGVSTDSTVTQEALLHYVAVTVYASCVPGEHPPSRRRASSASCRCKGFISLLWYSCSSADYFLPAGEADRNIDGLVQQGKLRICLSRAVKIVIILPLRL